jgi:hypothetical protein
MKTWTSPSTTTIAVESLLRDEPRHAPGGHQPSPLVVRSSVAPHLLTSSMAIIKRSSHKGRAKRCVGRARFGHGTVTSYGFALRNTRGSLVRANRVVLSVGGDPPSGHGGEITRRTSRGV